MQEYLEVRTSNIPGAGRGLFVTKDIKPYTKILDCIGKKLTQESYNDNPSRYALQLFNGHVLDLEGPCRYANECRDSDIHRGYCSGTNAEFILATHSQAYLYSTKYIEAGSEIFVDYGPGYWDRIV